MNLVAPIPGPAEPTLIHRLTSIVDRLDFAVLFARREAVEVELELGCGDGGFLVEYARQHPEQNFLGVERLLGRLRKLDRKGRRARLTNLCGLRIEAGYCLEYLLPPASIRAFHVYFPDPWPKRRHWRRRLVNERFPGFARQALVVGGRVYFRTDHPEYFDQIQGLFAGRSGYQPVKTPPELAALPTDFEREFATRGVQTLRAAYETTSD